MSITDDIKELIKEGEDLAPKGGEIFSGYNSDLQPDYVSWRLQSISTIQELGKSANPLLREIEQDNNGPYFYRDSAQNILGVLKAAAAISEKQDQREQKLLKPDEYQSLSTGKENAVFVVHGHDETLLQQVARFLEKLEIKPIILFEKPGKGRTIIEKLEAHSDVPFAIVLLTPDDLGKASKNKDLKPRARQNVILELGFFLGKLKRNNVAVLYDESIELPSDYRGVEYIKIDVEGAWQLRLAKEMKASNLNIDMNKVL
ncbi:MAG: TIR domain-containing protein [Candidatus Hodarchaeales archaeon]